MNLLKNMSKSFVIYILFLLSCSSGNEEKKKEVELVQHYTTTFISSEICEVFDSLNTNIRNGLIKKEEGLVLINNLLPRLRNYFYENGGKDYAKSTWFFPIQGYDSKAIGGTNGSGYIASGYDYFDGNKHGGHPAHDIFIKDKNQDSIDDMTKKSVNVFSVTGGIVIATEIRWDTTSNLRGGKYIWIYDPASNSFFYYAHNDKVLVHLCDIVKPGDVIATVGRSGLNAFKKRSPTHLHIMQLKLDDNCYPKPADCYNDLKVGNVK